MTVRDRELVLAWAGWARDRRDLEPDVMDTLVSFKRDYLDDGHDARWHEGQLTELLLNVLPRKVLADDEWLGAVVPTVRSFLRFADETHALHRESAPASRLLAEVERIEPFFAEVIHDEAAAAVGTSVLSAMGVDGGDLLDPDVFQITDPALRRSPSVELPPVLLPPEAELAEAARRSPLLRQVVSLATWVGRRRSVTPTGVLKIAEARTAVSALGLWDRSEPDGGDPTEGQLDLGLEELPAVRIQSARDVEPLNLLWILATSTGLVEVGATVARSGPTLTTWRRDDDADVLSTWCDVFTVVMELGVDGGRERSHAFAGEVAVDRELLSALPGLYLGESVAVDDLVDQMTATARAIGRSDDDMHRLIVLLSLNQLLQRMEEVGALVRSGDGEGVLEMTALGRWGVREQLVRFGAHAPVVQAVSASAIDLLGQTSVMMPPEQFAQAWSQWIGARDGGTAAREVLAAARTGTALTRTVAFDVLQSHLRADADDVLVGLLDDPVVGAHARAWLLDTGRLPSSEGPSPEQLRYLIVDLAASLLEGLPAGVPLGELPAEVWAFLDDGFGLDTVWEVDHPQLLDILDAVGKGHPSGRTRKAAKKAAFKARGRHGDGVNVNARPRRPPRRQRGR